MVLTRTGKLYQTISIHLYVRPFRKKKILTLIAIKQELRFINNSQSNESILEREEAEETSQENTITDGNEACENTQKESAQEEETEEDTLSKDLFKKKLMENFKENNHDDYKQLEQAAVHKIQIDTQFNNHNERVLGEA